MFYSALILTEDSILQIYLNLNLICLPFVSIISEQSIWFKGHGSGYGNGSLDIRRIAAHNGLLFLRSHVSLWV